MSTEFSYAQGLEPPAVRAANAKSRESLPRIVRFLGTDDAPGSQCPHCGAEGRFILRFQVEDGTVRAAMRGCAKLFPTSKLAIEDLRLREKEARYAKQGWKLNRADADARYAIEQFYLGKFTESHALTVSKSAKAQAQRRFAGARR